MSMKLEPWDRVTADADAGRLAEAGVGGLLNSFVGQVPERETIPTLPGR